MSVSNNFERNQLIRKEIIFIFKKLLAHEAGTIGIPFNDKSLLWNFLQDENLKVVLQFYKQLLQDLKTSNQYTVDHSVILSYCTGSHNNTSFLGGKEQSKSAMFYIAPYMAKEKASLTACLTILEKSRKEVKIYPSKSCDQSIRPKERLTKHFLTKVVNKLNAFIELSDYQVAAYLMNMPSIITSEIFQYCETYGAINYRSNLIKNKLNIKEFCNDSSDEDEKLSYDDKKLYFGYVKTFVLERGEEKNDDIKQMIPIVSCYFNRGESLQGLSQSEYNSFIQIKEKPKGNNGTQRSSCFEFANGFELAPNYEQVLCQKQKTLIFKGKAPQHPGNTIPKSNILYSNWIKKANRYANYILTMFCPSRIFKGEYHNDCEEAYSETCTWEDLLNWITQLQCDDSVISKFRLMAIDKRMNVLRSDFATKKMLSEYRARSVDYWSTLEKRNYKEEERLFSQLERNQDIEFLDETTFEEKHVKLNQHKAKTAIKMDNDMKSFVAEIFKTDNSSKELISNGWKVSLENCRQICIYIGSGQNVADWEYNYQKFYENENIENYTINNDSKEDTTITNQYKHDEEAYFMDLNLGQKEIISIYYDYLIEEIVREDIRAKVPNIVLLTGKGGTGKSYVIHRLLQIGNQNYIQNECNDNVKSVWTIANNNLNAVDIDGITIASLLHQRIEKKQDESNDSIVLVKKISMKAIKYLEDQQIDKNLRLIILDEISNITVQKLGQLSRLFEIGMKNNKLFGGIPVLLVGDFNQKKPIGELATKSLLDLVKNKYDYDTRTKINNIASNECDDDGFMLVNNSPRKKKKKEPKSNAIFLSNKENIISDYSIGCKVLSEARWFELTEAERSKDKLHNELLDHLYKGNAIDILDLTRYKIFNKETIDRDNELEKYLWMVAPVIVKSNRERISLNYIRALIFAKETNTLLVRWLADTSKWEGKPNDNQLDEVIEDDPAFWEIFVYNAPCYLSETICKRRKLCNGTKALYYNIIIDDELANEYKEEIYRNGNNGIITLSKPPKAIELLINDRDIISYSKDWWNEFGEYEDESDREPAAIKIPIKPKTSISIEKPTYIVPKSLLCEPCSVIIKSIFPITCGFAITVDKVQGQTLDRVIIALSEREHKLMNFTYSCFYVGMSRVKIGDHLRILLKDKPNEVEQWHSLAYLTTLRKEKSVDAYFSGFDKRNFWVENKWNEERALQYFLNIDN